MEKIFSNIKGDIFGGITAAIIALPLAIAFGVLTFAPLGPEYTAQGALAGLYGAIFTGIFAALFGGTPSQITGPTGPITVVMTSVIAGLMQNPPLPGDPSSQIPAILTLAFFCVFFGGAFQVGFGLLRMGTLIKYIPYPVIAGFMNGIAVIIFLGQVQPFLGVGKGAGFLEIISLKAHVQPLTILVGIVTIVVMLLSPKLIRALPGSLTGLIIGSLSYYILKALFPSTPMGEVIGKIPSAIPMPVQLREFVGIIGNPDMLSRIPMLLAPSLTLGVLGSIDSLLTSVVADTVTKTRHNSNKELIGQGLGNLVSAFFAGLAGAGATVRTLVNVNAGGRTPLSGIIHGVSILLVLLVFGSLAGKIPMAVLAGILLVTAVKMVDEWSSRLAWKLTGYVQERKRVLINIFVVLLVTIVTVTVDLMIAVGIGLVTASLLFVIQMSSSIIKRRYDGSSVHSKQVRAPALMDILAQKGKQIVVFEIQGPIFFGTADKLLQEIEAVSQDCLYFILDLKRVGEIDSTGIKILQQIQGNLQPQQKYLLISHVKKEKSLRRFLEDLGLVAGLGEEHFFDDTDTALEWAENRILEDQGEKVGIGEMPLESMDIVRSFSREEIDELQKFLSKSFIQAGELIFKKGEKGDTVFVLAKGTVDIFIEIPEEKRMKRITTFSPGVVIGEMAMLEEVARTADVRADEDIIVYSLSIEDINALSKQHPETAVKLMLNIARQLASRLRMTSKEVAALEQ